MSGGIVVDVDLPFCFLAATNTSNEDEHKSRITTSKKLKWRDGDV